MTNRRVLAQPEILWREWCKELQDDGVRFEYDYCGGHDWRERKLDNRGYRERIRIKGQPIPDKIKDWQAWCLKWQERGLRFECEGGVVENKIWRFDEAKDDYTIQTQPIPTKFIEETEMNVEEVTIKIRVSEDVTFIDVCLGRCGIYYHNKKGPAKIGYRKNKKGEWEAKTTAYYLNDNKQTPQEFQRLTQPAKEMTVEDIEKLLGYRVKVVGG